MTANHFSSCSSPDSLEKGYFSQFADSFQGSFGLHAECKPSAGNCWCISHCASLQRSPKVATPNCCSLIFESKAWQLDQDIGSSEPGAPVQLGLRDHCSHTCSADFSRLTGTGDNAQSRSNLLLDRLKEAHGTINHLLTKILKCGKDISSLRKHKDSCESALAAARLEIDELKKNCVAQDLLLGRVSELGNDVACMLQTQEEFLEKHAKQEAEISRLKSEIQIAELECKQLKELNIYLEKDSKGCKRELELVKSLQQNHESQQTTLKTENDALSVVNNRLQREIQTLESDLEKHKTMLHQCEKRLVQHQEIGMLSNKQLQKLEDRIRYLESEIDVSRCKRKNEVANLLQKCSALESSSEIATKEMLHLKEQIAAAGKEKESLSNEVLEVKRDLGILRAQKELSDRNGNGLVLLNSDLESKLQEKHGVVSSLEHQVKSMAIQIKIASQENMDLRLQLEELQDQSKCSQKVHEQEQEQLFSRLESLRLEFANEKIDLLNNYNQQLAEKDDSLRMISDSLGTAVSEKEKLHINISALELQVKKMDERDSYSVAALQKLLDDTCLAKKTLEDTILVKDQMVFNLNEELISEQAKLNVLDLACCEARRCAQDSDNKLKETSIQLEEAVRQNELLRADVNSSLKLLDKLHETHKKSDNEEVKRLFLLVKQCKKDLAAKESSLRSLQTEQIAISAKFEADMADMKKDASIRGASLEQELQSLKDQIAESRSDLLICRKQKDELAMQVCDYSEKLKLSAQVLEEIPSIRQEKTSLQEKLDLLACDLNRITFERDCLMQQQKEASSYTADLLKKLSSLLGSMEKQQEEACRDRASALTKEQKLIQEHRFASDNYVRLVEHCKQQQTLETESLYKEIDTYKSEILNLNLELTVLRDLNAKCEEQNSQLELEKADLLAQFEQIKSDMCALKLAFEQLLSEQLAKQKAEFAQRESDLISKLGNQDMKV